MEEFFQTAWLQFTGLLRTFQFTDMLDILMVTYIIYKLFQIIRDTRAAQLVKGIVIVFAVYLLVSLFNLRLMTSIFVNMFQVGIFVIFVVFQPELRAILEQLGRSKLGKINIFNFGNISDEENKNEEQLKAINAVVDGCMVVKRLKMGALVVFEKNTNLGDIINSGTVLDAKPSTELVGNIFFNKAPLHDGAMIIRNCKVYAAGCILPLTKNIDISSDLGTRHRAGLGMSENSDAIIVIVSEETGNISIAKNGVLTRNYTKDTLRASLINEIIVEETHNKNQKNIRTKLKSTKHKEETTNKEE